MSTLNISSLFAIFCKSLIIFVKSEVILGYRSLKKKNLNSPGEDLSVILYVSLLSNNNISFGTKWLYTLKYSGSIKEPGKESETKKKMDIYMPHTHQGKRSILG